MRKIFTFLVVIISLFAGAQVYAQGNGATITVEESRCVATGVLTASGAQGTGPFLYDFVAYPVDYAYTGPSASNVITALNPGSYTLRIIDQGAGNSFTDYSVVIPGNYIEPDYNPTATDVTNCYNGTNGSIQGTLIDGRAPFSYEIIAGPMGVGTMNNTGTFTGLGPGTYSVRGYDSCGNFQTRQVTINNFFWGISSPIVTKSACGQYSFDAISISQVLTGHSYRVKDANGNIIATNPTLPISFSHPDATIANATVCVVDACGTELCNNFTIADWSISGCNIIYTACNTYEATASIAGSPIGPLQYFITRAPGDTVWSATVPFTYTKLTTYPTYNGDNYTSVYVKDGCGVIKSCGSFYQDIYGGYNWSYENCSTNTITLSPSWYYINPVTYTMTSPVLGLPQASPTYTGLADGTYTFDITDACGHIHTESLNMSHDWQLSGGGSSTSCTMGKTYTSFFAPGNLFAPAVFNRYDASFNLVGVNPMPYTAGNVWTFDDNLDPNTTYNYIVTDNCGRIDTVTISTGAGSTPMTHSTTVTPLCVNHGNINATSATDHGGYLSSEIGLLNGPGLYNNQYYGNQGNTPYTVYYNNLDTGKYWVKYWSSYCANDVFYDTVEIKKYNLPKLRKSIAFNCGGGNVNAVGSVKGGLAPYMYEIIQTFPVDNPQPPQASNVFTLAGTYTLVRMRVVDACGNTSLQDIAVRPPAQPTMKVNSNLPVCNLSALVLYVDSTIPGRVYEWRNPANAIIGTNASVSLTGLSPITDTGLYTCKITIPGTCFDVTTTFRLRSKDFGCYAKLGNYVWLDADKDGVQDANEVGVAGITVTLYNAANDVVSATVTDAYGYYLFDNLNADTYHVGFTLPANYVFSPKDQGGNDATDSDPNLLTGLTGDYVIIVGDSNMTVDAGIYFIEPVKASLGDFVWNDANANGIQDPGEVGIAGVTVTLKDALGNPIATTVTDASGHYYFTDLDPGTYSVAFTKPIGYVFSPQNQGVNDAADSDVDPVMGMTSNVTLVAGENNLTLDAGLYAQAPNLASLGNYVWNDADNDGIQDPAEAGVAGVTVTLYAGDGVTVIGTTTTDEFGYYIFNNLTPGDYVVGFSDLPLGYVFSPSNAGANDATDSDPDGVSGKTGVINLSAGEKDMTIDAGIHNPAQPIGALGNFVWFDYDKDGIQDLGENGVPGVTVTLYDGLNNVLAITATDASGHYLFNNLGAGNYIVGFSNIPAGYKVTTSNQGVDDAVDSDPNEATVLTGVIALALGEVNLTVDAGIVEAGGKSGSASLGDRVWNDANNNGIQDPGELGVEGVTVTLYEADGITVISTLVTDALGNYLFTGLDAGSYKVGFSNLPAGFTFSTANQGPDDELDGDADAGTGGLTGIYTLAEGEDDLTVDAGIHQAPGLASLGNYVWNDLNLDGIQDGNEPGVPGVTVTLFASNGTQLAVTTTNAAGGYQFTGLAPGSYYVEFTNLPAGYEFTDKDAGANAQETEDSDADPITGATEWVTLVAGQNYPDLDAGIFTEKAGLGNFVWNDYDNDGVQDPGEPGIPGIAVTLCAADGVTPVATAITDANGQYSFVNLEPGTYYVGFSNIPAGSNFSGKDLGGDDALDSDVNPATGKTGAITLDAGEYNPTVDAGVHVPQGAGLGNYVWIDANSDGIQNANEIGVPGVTVTLFNAAGNAIQNTITDQNGFYTFPNLAPGTYSVGFSTLPPNLAFTLSDIGANDSNDNDVVNITSLPNGLPSFGQTAQVTIVAGEYNPTIDAGLKVQFPLGITSIQASATLAGSTATVYWTTVDEKDVKNFEIERSIDNKVFTKMQTKTAKGNTIGNTNYSTNDDIQDLMKEINVYYRVKVYDLDGQYLYSNTVVVNPTQTAVEDVVLYPTPFTTEITVGYNATVDSELEIEITDMVGSVVKKQTQSVTVGQNQLLINELGALSTGNYFVKVVDLNINKTFVKKVTKK
jgi:protocatechuate 3,4-dioxygenase beta subunit